MFDFLYFFLVQIIFDEWVCFPCCCNWIGFALCQQVLLVFLPLLLRSCFQVLFVLFLLVYWSSSINLGLSWWVVLVCFPISLSSLFWLRWWVCLILIECGSTSSLLYFPCENNTEKQLGQIQLLLWYRTVGFELSSTSIIIVLMYQPSIFFGAVVQWATMPARRSYPWLIFGIVGPLDP